MRFASVALVAAAMSLLVSALPTQINDEGVKPLPEGEPPFAYHGALEHPPLAPAVPAAPAAPVNKQREAEGDAPEEHPEPTTPASTEPEPEGGVDVAGAPAGIVDRSDDYLGQSVVYNNCPFAVHSNIVHGPRPGVEGPPEEIYSILQPQQVLSHPFAHDPQMGVSWKLWRTDVDNTAPVQFEWTWHNSFQRTWYDLSMINAGKAAWLNEDAHQGEAIVGDKDGLGAYVGEVAIKHAFKEEGMTLTPNVVGGNCVPLHCAPGEEFCTASYNVHNDWGQQHDCGEAVDLTLTLCG
ncbi:uncharacterized protein Z520_03809 [Fonsecaea multimorphosa CBS 102226]|uniref:SCP domain-containing protein n=1 Tax=Fonsecaea multimorphosa CBS 102226 TaxID=1442371 RepID=A0A0D2KTM4_9EURO|nr:uncharacterized protein Z520_03809 [Fonsecaea multimorphosa CBS 102226]KIY00124.1 hypothetical protein Z520_03809 [Fonsecaea multimorphosa CBS 102226]OAL27319.1 hypothetical protein AYO22_03594 [Fonsecaea multimorphosa]